MYYRDTLVCRILVIIEDSLLFHEPQADYYLSLISWRKYGLLISTVINCSVCIIEPWHREHKTYREEKMR